MPAAVTAFNERSLDRIQAQDPTGLQGAVPNLNIVQGRGSSNATNIYIRGIGQPDALQTFDPAVGVYVDGVYYSRIRGTQFDLLDLAAGRGAARPAGHALRQEHDRRRAQLRHPPAGPANCAARSPRPTAPTTRSSCAASSPALIETIGIGIASLHAQRDGYVEDPVLNRDYNDKNTEAVRGTSRSRLRPISASISPRTIRRTTPTSPSASRKTR